MKREIISWLVILLLNLPVAALYVIGPEKEQEPSVEIVEAETEIIQWKQEDTQEEVLEVTIEVMELEEVKEPEMKSLGIFRITAYCPCSLCSDSYGYQTSTGVRATEGRTVAVDPTVIPYGTVIIIDGHEYLAEDCGAEIRDNDIDIFYENHEAAEEFGVKYMEVFIWQ